MKIEWDPRKRIVAFCDLPDGSSWFFTKTTFWEFPRDEDDPYSPAWLEDDWIQKGGKVDDG